MCDNVSVGSGGVGVSVSMVSTTSGASGDEEVKDDEEYSAHDDDKQDVDEINHTKLSQEVVHGDSPSARVRGDPVWQDLNRFTKYNVPDREIKTDCTHICVYPLSDDESVSRRYCNTSLKLFR